MHKERVSWVDVCKGIGIILVLYGHALSANSFRHIIYSFHMPLFFFLSGIVFRYSKQNHFFPFLKKNVKNILYPYFFFAFLTFGFAVLQAKNPNPFSPAALHQFFGIFYGNGNNGYLAFNVVLWFLPCLFITRVAFGGITHFVTEKKTIISVLVATSLFAFFFSLLFPKLKLIFGIETALTAIVFFGFGYLWNTKPETIEIFFQKHKKAILLLTAFLCVIIASLSFDIYGSQIDMRQNRFHNYFFFYGAALSGILATVSLSVIIGKNKMLEYIGKASLLLFIWHFIVFSYLSKFFRLILPEQILRDGRNTYMAPLYTALTILIVCTAAWGINWLRNNAARSLVRK